jgi:hypothetical protein
MEEVSLIICAFEKGEKPGGGGGAILILSFILVKYS